MPRRRPNPNQNHLDSPNTAAPLRENGNAANPGDGGNQKEVNPNEENRTGAAQNNPNSSGVNRSGQNRNGQNRNSANRSGNTRNNSNRNNPNRTNPNRGGVKPNGGNQNRSNQAKPNQNRTNQNGVNHPPSVPRKARGGIKARSSEGGEFGKNWWAKRWLSAMERLMDGARLSRGRRYARMGQVVSMNEANGGVVARVQGSRPVPYKVTIRVEPLSEEQWQKVLDVLAGRAIFTAQLLAGEMPSNIEEAFSAADVSLFPARGGDLMTECSCPDWANPCKHIAAAHYILGDRFDEDPFLLFRLRGRTQDQILQGLRQRRSGQEEPVEEKIAEPEEVQPLEEHMATFWEIGPEVANFAVNIQQPAIPLPLLKRLGEPDFARQFPLEKNLGPAYEAISQAALILAFSDIARENGDNGSESS